MNILNVWERLTMSVTTHPSKGMCDSRTKELRRSIHLRVSFLESNNYLMWLVASSVRPISPGLTNSVRSCPRDLFGKQNKTKKKFPLLVFLPRSPLPFFPLFVRAQLCTALLCSLVYLTDGPRHAQLFSLSWQQRRMCEAWQEYYYCYS